MIALDSQNAGDRTQGFHNSSGALGCILSSKLSNTWLQVYGYIKWAYELNNY